MDELVTFRTLSNLTQVRAYLAEVACFNGYTPQLLSFPFPLRRGMGWCSQIKRDSNKSVVYMRTRIACAEKGLNLRADLLDRLIWERKTLKNSLKEDRPPPKPDPIVTRNVILQTTLK